jgi:hypothetical protein
MLEKEKGGSRWERVFDEVVNDTLTHSVQTEKSRAGQEL